MRINDAVARLVRAGDENSQMWEKIKKSIDEFAKLLAMYYPTDKENELPRGYTFRHWPPSREYRFIKNNRFFLGDQSKPKEDIMLFCDDIQAGFLEEISAQLEKETGFLSVAADKLSRFDFK